jgi:hypothetical protein
VNHVAHLLHYLEMRSPTAEDRRAALLAAIETAATTDKGMPIAKAIIASFRENQALLPAANMIERMGFPFAKQPGVRVFEKFERRKPALSRRRRPRCMTTSSMRS